MYVLEKMWQEGLIPSERFTRSGSEYHKALQRLCKAGEDVSEELSEKGKENFTAYRDAQIDLSQIMEQEVFIEAFRMGAQIVLDILGDYKGSFRSVGEE